MKQYPNERELLEATLDLDPDEHAEFLIRQCGENVGLRERVERLLTAHARAEAYTSDRVGPLPFIEQEMSQPAELLPESIGGYRILRLLGRGGMGSVFEAEQESPRRVVALKVITSMFLTDQVRKRFALEAEVLGRLQHPSIAQVYEVGVFERDGASQPYIAMELIHGKSLAQFADDQKLDTRARLKLLSRVCEGVQHAHQRGIIHRDLKPDNILVDDEGQPKILDFGLARVTNSDMYATSLHTHVGQIMGTLPYMSPEQALGDPNEVDIRSDIYSMGVVAYELVSGRMPYSTRTPLLVEALRVLREESPRPLSSISRNLRGDVDTIVGKALEKEPDRRYASAAAMADDIRRYLNEEPILAHPPSAIYQMRKFTQRHRAFVMGLAVVLLAVIVGSVGMLRGYAAAARSGEQTKSTADFFRTVLTGVDPAVAQGQDTKLLRSILDDTAARIGAELGGEPRVAATMHETMATAYASIAEHESAYQQGQLARELMIQEYGIDSLEAVTVHLGQCIALNRMNRVAEAKAEFEECIARIHRALATERELADKARLSLGVLFLDVQDYEEAAKRLEPSLAYSRARSEPDSEQLMVALNSLGVARLGQDRLDESESLLKEALALRERVSGRVHPDTIRTLLNLGSLYKRQGRIAESKVTQLDGVGRAEEVMGTHHEVTLIGKENLAVLLVDTGQNEEALELRSQIFATRLALHGADDSRTLGAEETLAISYRTTRQFQLAEKHARHASEGLQSWFGLEHRNALASRVTLAMILSRAGKLQEAEKLMESLLESYVRVDGADSSQVFLLQSELAIVYQLTGQPSRAEESYRAALIGRRQVLGPGHASTLATVGRFARFLHDGGRSDEAIPLYGDYLVRWGGLYGVEHRNLTRVSARLLDHFARVDRLGPHESQVRAVLDYHERATPDDAGAIATDLIYLAQALVESGDTGGATECLSRVDTLPPGGAPPLPARQAWAAEACGLASEAQAALEAVWQATEDAPATERRFAARRLAEKAEVEGRAADAVLWRERAVSID
ncbi:Serine/threonine-protein kinase PknB [Planctomycetes bacterium Poly30]|uniref:non-specific serine/threonine protein kinase n=1 Tax=Saltatorellus ferox TaxID=2528018 RepID=A0A518EKZ5_9BACT|nr:Serine/threonine-protein kinase PknB [Planctomycetes bacterium Poly30]